MKAILIVVTAITLAAGFVGCESTGPRSHADTPQNRPPGSGGRGQTPGMAAHNQNPNS